jgi:hypothetical protein
MSLTLQQSISAQTPPSERSFVTHMPNGLTRVHGRIGGEQEFIEFQVEDGLSFCTQRSGSDYPVFRNSKGAMKALGGVCPGSLAEGERMARQLADEHLATMGPSRLRALRRN